VINNNDLSRSIRALADPDHHARETAAAEIFASGCELARPILDQWNADEELARIFVRGAEGIPEQTVGIAVEPAHFERIRSAYGFPALAEVPPDQDALEFELEYPTGVRLDILTTRDPSGSGAIAGFLRKFGEGIQQIEILVASVDRSAQILRTRFGIELVYPSTRAGANATRVNFFLVPSPAGGKVLVDLVEAKAPSRGL
jgi:hypothetical protein